MLVFDFGGGTLDVTVMQSARGGSFKVLSTDGDTALGGEDIDALVVTHLAHRFETETGVSLLACEDPVKRAKAFKKLWTASAELKVDLSRVATSDYSIDEILGEYSLEGTLTRLELEDIAAPVLSRIPAPLHRALDKARGGLAPAEIDLVLLVGGSSRIPKVQEMLGELFPGVELCRRINPDEAVVCGAAIEASRSIDLHDIVPRPLCIATANHRDRARSLATPLIPAGTPIPPEGIEATESFANSRDNQDTITIRLCEGEGEYFDDNLRLGVFHVSDIPQRPRGQVTITVTMKVNMDGILSLTASVDETGQQMQATVTSSKGRMSEDDLALKRRENEAFQAKK